MTPLGPFNGRPWSVGTGIFFRIIMFRNFSRTSIYIIFFFIVYLSICSNQCRNTPTFMATLSFEMFQITQSLERIISCLVIHTRLYRPKFGLLAFNVYYRLRCAGISPSEFFFLSKSTQQLFVDGMRKSLINGVYNRVESTMETNKSKKLCCTFCVKMVKSIPVIFILCILAWAYYAYVYHLCISMFAIKFANRTHLCILN